MASVDENAGFAGLAVDVSRIPHKLHAGCHCGEERVVAGFQAVCTAIVKISLDRALT